MIVRSVVGLKNKDVQFTAVCVWEIGIWADLGSVKRRVTTRVGWTHLSSMISSRFPTDIGDPRSSSTLL
jgi:hypothetical protein